MWAHSAAEIGKIVAVGRRHLGVTQAQLAALLGVTQHWISQIEQGKDGAQIGKIMQVLSFLGVRLQVGEAPWMTHELAKSKKPKPQKVSLADILAAHSDASTPQRKAKR